MTEPQTGAKNPAIIIVVLGLAGASGAAWVGGIAFTVTIALASGLGAYAFATRARGPGPVLAFALALLLALASGLTWGDWLATEKAWIPVLFTLTSSMIAILGLGLSNILGPGSQNLHSVTRKTEGFLFLLAFFVMGYAALIYGAVFVENAPLRLPSSIFLGITIAACYLLATFRSLESEYRATTHGLELLIATTLTALTLSYESESIGSVSDGISFFLLPLAGLFVLLRIAVLRAAPLLELWLRAPSQPKGV